MKIILTIVVLLFSLNCAFACRPYGYPNPPVEFIAAKTGKMFIGTVVSKSSVILKYDDYKVRLHSIKFKVEKALKGVDGEFQTISFKAPLKGYRNTCDQRPPEFKKGTQWIIHENYQNKKAENIIIWLEYGNYTKYSVERNWQYIEYLEKVINQPTTGIYGEVHTVMSSSRIIDAEVVAEGNGQRFTTRTGEFGEYSFTGIPAGKYKIKIILPYRSADLLNRREPVFDEQKQAFYLEYEVTVNPLDSEYEFTVINDKN